MNRPLTWSPGIRSERQEVPVLRAGSPWFLASQTSIDQPSFTEEVIM
jgi:hypothetical protein